MGLFALGVSACTAPPDTTPPETQIDSGPPDPTNSSSASFTFSADEPNSTFECRRNSGSWSGCSSPKQYTGLTDRTHSFETRATDAAGNTDQTPARRTWKIDTVAPNVSLSCPPAPQWSTSSPVSCTGSWADPGTSPSGIPVGGVAYRVDSDPGTGTSYGSWTYYGGPIAVSAEGRHHVELLVGDRAGNSSTATVEVKIDTLAPETTVDSGPSGAINDASPSFGFSSDDPAATFECKLDAEAWSPCSSPKDYADLPEGPHDFSVRATDEAGNTDASPATSAFTVDTTAPETTIDSGPTGTVNNASPSFTFSADDPTATFECKLDAEAWAPCSSPKDYADLPDGAHDFEVRATDEAGNTDASPATSAFTVDTTAPETTIESGPVGPTNVASPSFGFSSDDPAATFECKLDAEAWAPCSSPKDYTDLPDGPHDFSVRATSEAGNTDPSPATSAFTVDTTAPETTFDSGPTGTVNNASPSFAFSADDPAATFECKLDAEAWAPCSSPKDYTDLPDGPHDFSVRATDEAGNTDASPATSAFTVDTTAPETTIDSGPSGTTGEASPSFGFSSDDPAATFECKLDAEAWAPCSSPKDYTDLPDGPHDFSVRATDEAGNTDQTPASRSFTIDSGPVSYSGEVTGDAPLGYWRLGEASGTAAADQVGANSGAYQGGPALGAAGAVSADADTAVDLDGVDDSISIADDPALKPTGSLSLEAWIRPEALPSDTAALMRKSGQFLLRLKANGGVTFRLWKGGSTIELSSPAGGIDVDAWNHVVATWDGSTTKIWINGQLEASGAVAGPIDSSGSTLHLGTSSGYDWLAARLDEVAIYGTELSAARVQAHYDAADPPDTTAPAVTLTAPLDGANAGPTPTFSGAAGSDPGDEQEITVRIYSGSVASGTPVQTLTTDRSGNSWSVTASDPLPAGTYTAEAEQSDAAGNTGLSAARTFSSELPVTYGDEVTADAPRAYWRLGESSGATAADEAGNHPGTYESGPALGQPGAIGGSPNTAVSFDGTNDQLRVPNSAGLSSSTAFSIETWVKADQLPSYTSTIARKSGQFQLRLRYDGALSLIVWKNGSQSAELRTDKGLIAPDAWYHVVVTYDGSDLEIWRDGAKLESLSISAPLSVSGSALFFGSSGGYDHFDGTLDELALYHSALSPARITAHLERAYEFDDTPPAIVVRTPTAGSTMEASTNLGGTAGITFGDLPPVTLRLWQGPTAAGDPLRTIETVSRKSGSFSALAGAPLPSGTYTVRAEQSDARGNVGLSDAVTFSVDADANPTLLAAGDIGYCSGNPEATASVLDGFGGTVAMLGDAAYPNGTPAEFDNCYDPSWGRHLARTRPIPGDHDYGTPGASGYFNYFGAAAGDPSKGYYSFDIGDWHVVALNSVCYEDNSCGNAIETWLENDLAANPATCTVGLLHEPLFSSGNVHGNNLGVHWLWQLMYNGGVDIVLSGSEHIYERFGKQTPDGVADPQNGIREFIVGTGGRGHYEIGTVQPNSEVINTDTFGILKLTLNPDSYDWQFLPEAGKSFTDAGSDVCH